MCQRLRERLIIEQKYKNQILAISSLKDNLDEFEEKISALDSFNKLNVSKDKKDELFLEIHNIFNEVFVQKNDFPNNFIHDFSDTQLTNILLWIDQSINLVPNQIIKQTQELEKTTMKRRHLEELFQKIPSDAILSPIVKDLNSLYSKNGEIISEIKKNDELIRSTNYKLNEINRESQKLFEKRYDERLFHKRLEYLESTQTVLTTYIQSLRNRKIKDLSTIFTECINLYLNKNDLVSQVEINPEDYSINLQRLNGAKINKNDLSAGEKQIYAIAMLMALARSSGRPLPFIIDTPLARLDSVHRKKIVSQFFPYASHQVIVFSTDTEIDTIHFKELAPFISKAYHLTYNSKTSSTSVKEGYFWRKEEVISHKF